MKNKLQLNLDKIEVCYTASPEVIEDLKDTRYRELEGFRFFTTEDKGTKESHYQIDIQLPNADGVLDWVRFGTMKIGSTFDKEEEAPTYIWIRIDNRMLYTPIYPDTPTATYLYFIADSLNLIYNNITKVDLAIDGNLNYFSRIKKAVRNMELTPIVLGAAYPEKKEIIKKLLYIHTADRTRYRTGTISISSSEKDFSLSVYNKSEEITESGKDYIREWTSLNDTIHRVEVRLKRTALKDYLSSKGNTFEDLYCNLFDKETQFALFSYFSDKLLRFRSGRSIISILEL